MKERKKGVRAQDKRFKGEAVPEKDTGDLEPTGRYVKRNPYKTPPNNLTTKDR